MIPEITITIKKSLIYRRQEDQAQKKKKIYINTLRVRVYIHCAMVSIIVTKHHKQRTS